MDEEQVFEAVPLNEAVCPVGGGHQFILSGRYFHRVSGKLVEHITCVKCGLISVGSSYCPPADIMDVEGEVVE